MRKLLIFAGILTGACFTAMTVYAAFTRTVSAPTVFEAEQQHTGYDEAGNTTVGSWRVVSYRADGTYEMLEQQPWMRFIGLTTHTVTNADGQQDAYFGPVPIPIRTTHVMTVAMLRKANPEFGKTCNVPSNGKMLREELLHGYRTAVIERFEPRMQMRMLYWNAIASAGLFAHSSVRTAIRDMSMRFFALSRGADAIAARNSLRFMGTSL